MSNPLNNELLGNPLSSSANAGQYEAGDTISTIHGDMEVTGVDFMGRPQVDRYGKDLNWEDSFGPASKHLGVTEAEWEAFISGVNEIKAEMREYEGNDARVMQRRSQGEDPVAERRIGVLMNTQGLTREEAENEVYNSEQYIKSNAEFEQYNELNQQLNDLYASVGLDSTGAIQGSGTSSPGYAVNFDFVSGDVSHTKGDAIHDIGKMAVLGAAGVVAGPALAGALGSVLGPAAAKAASSAIINLATQYMSTGEIDWKQALISAATSYGGAKLGEALKGSDALSGIGDKISGVTDKFNEVLDKTGSIGSAAIKAGGMSMLTQMVSTGEIDVKQAGLAALMAAGSAGLSEFQASLEAAGTELTSDDLQEIVVEAKRVGTDVGGGMTQLENGLVINEAGQIIGNMSDIDLDGDGMLSANDLQEITTPPRDLVNPNLPKTNQDLYSAGDKVYVDANGNAVDPVGVKYSLDKDSYVTSDGTLVTETSYAEAFQNDGVGAGNDSDFGPVDNAGGLVWQANGPTDGVVTFEDGTFYAKKVDGQWIGADGSIIDDPRVVDELTMVAAKAIDTPLESVQYFDQDGNPVNYKYAPHDLRDSLENGQFSGLIFGPNGEAQEVWYDPTTGTEYVKSDQGFVGVEQVELPEDTPEPVEPVEPEPVEPVETTEQENDNNQTTSNVPNRGGAGSTSPNGNAGTPGSVTGGVNVDDLLAGLPNTDQVNPNDEVEADLGNPLTGGPTVDMPTDPAEDIEPSDGTGIPAQTTNAQIEALMDRGMTYEQAVANQNAAISAGADANGDGMVTNAEWSAHTGQSGAGETISPDDGSGNDLTGGDDNAGDNDGDALDPDGDPANNGGTVDGDDTGSNTEEGPGTGADPEPGGGGPGPGPGTGPGTGPGLGDGMLTGGGVDNYVPQWGELFEYTTITPYQAKQLEPVRQYIAKARGMLS